MAKLAKISCYTVYEERLHVVAHFAMAACAMAWASVAPNCAKSAGSIVGFFTRGPSSTPTEKNEVTAVPSNLH